MKLTYRTLHKARIVDAVLFWPLLALVVWGELSDVGAVTGLTIDDKLAHFTSYFVLGVMAAAAFRERRPVRIAVLSLIVLGGVLEIVQNYVGREPSVLDQLANTAGALTGGLVGRLIVEPLRRRFAEAP
jgi:VanZ family protein